MYRHSGNMLSLYPIVIIFPSFLSCKNSPLKINEPFLQNHEWLIPIRARHIHNKTTPSSVCWKARYKSKISKFI